MQTTGLTGLFVNENPHRSLKIVYGRILRTLEEIPVSAAYRKYTEQVIKRRLAIVEQVSEKFYECDYFHLIIKIIIQFFNSS